MNIRYPNRTAQAGVFYAGSPPSVALSGAALPGHLPLTAGALDGDDYVGVSVQSQVDVGRWLVGIARFDGTETLDLWSVETESDPPLADGTAVDVTVCITEQMLQIGFWRVDPLSSGAGLGALRLWRATDPTPDTATPMAAAIDQSAIERDYRDSDDSWSIESSGTSWNAERWWFDHTGAATTLILEPTGTWAAGYRPVRAWCEIHLATDFSYDAENPPRIIVEDSEAAVFTGHGVEPRDTSTPRWVQIWCDLALTGDIAQLRVENVGGSAFRVRNIAFEPAGE